MSENIKNKLSCISFCDVPEGSFKAKDDVCDDVQTSAGKEKTSSLQFRLHRVLARDEEKTTPPAIFIFRMLFTGFLQTYHSDVRKRYDAEN